MNTHVSNWIYQLQRVDPKVVGTIDADVKVVDPTRDGKERFTLAEVKTMRGRSSTRVLAYMSIGEAENYRAYWTPSWRLKANDCLGPENPDWPGNFKVKYWLQCWQDTVFKELDAIIEAGFDGVYLDIVDAFEFWYDRGVADADLSMAMFIAAIKAHASKTGKSFWVVPQNGERLLTYRPGVLDAVDAWAIEDLHYGDPNDGEPNASPQVAARFSVICNILDDSKPVLLVEYPSMPNWGGAVVASSTWRANGMTPYITRRDLDIPTGPLNHD